jgi:hypothetical protein
MHAPSTASQEGAAPGKGALGATAAFDCLRIRTEGSHRLVNDALGIDLTSLKGVKVWSEQKGLTLGLAYRF